MLSRALEGGAHKGRIRKGGKTNLSFFMVSKDKRKAIYDKWKRDKTSVEYKDVKSVKQGSQEFFKAQVRQLFLLANFERMIFYRLNLRNSETSWKGVVELVERKRKNQTMKFALWKRKLRTKPGDGQSRGNY